MDLHSNDVYWRLKNGLLTTYPTCREKLKCDVLVVGGGISGALAAEALSRAELSVVVIDKRDIGSGSTSASTAILQYEPDASFAELKARYGERKTEAVYRLGVAAIDRLEALAERLPGRADFCRRDSLYLASRNSHVAPLREELRWRQRLGISSDFLSPAQLERDYAFRRPAALRSSGAAEMDPYQMTHFLLRQVDRAGGKIFDRTRLLHWENRRTGVRAHLHTGARIDARSVIVATGYESAPLLPRGLVKLTSSFAVISKGHSEAPPWKKDCVIWETARPYLYLRSTSDGRWIVGGLDEAYKNPRARDAAIPAKSRKLQKNFGKLFPDTSFEVAYAWAGTFGESQDGLPYIGSLPRDPRCFYICGYGGNGIVFSAIAAEALAQTLRSGKVSEELKLFAFDR